eukprot:CCRYP_018532-RA/>CCRYP_018532-RA protein AED:0.01 eAED:0.01 QI:471/1/1/1/0/0/2/145/610
MSAVSSAIAASRCSVLSNGCRVVSLETCVTSRQKKSGYPTSTPFRAQHMSTYSSNSHTSRTGALAAATGVCLMCHSLRLTAACSASSALNATLHRRGNAALNGKYLHSSTAANSNLHMTSSVANGKYNQDHVMLRNEHLLPAHSSHAISVGCDLAPNCYSLAKASIHSSSRSEASSSMLLSNSLCGLTGQVINGNADFCGDINDTGWTISELFGAMFLASAATAGSLFLGPFGNLNGGSGGGSGGNNGPGGGGGGHKKTGGPGGGNDSTYEDDSKEAQVKVSVRALRGGRLSMEDEYIVVDSGRFSAVFDGHGGGGVSQYLRDHLHIIISEQLEKQFKNQTRKFRGDIKAFMFGKGLQGKTGSTEESKNKNDMTDLDNPTLKMKYDLSEIGQLPVSAVANALRDSFDQVDKEILANDEYEYQGSTAVAVLVHEANDGVRTLLSANIGDSRGILSRDGKAIDLTRDHKPNDDKEKARILAMGEKIEWDHYCKVHRVRNLSLSRAIGDRFAKPAVSGEVEIQRFPVYDGKDEFILLASDGLWDVMTSQEVVSYVHKRLNAAPKDGADIKTEEDMQSLKYLRRKNMSRFIANEALRRGSGDNISVVIVWLKSF